MEKIIIYTDGSSRGNPGRGGWAAIIESRSTSHEVRVEEIGGREETTTNNRMEMRAVIEALKKVPTETEVEIYADSEYVIKGITMWIWNWQKNNWRTKNNKPVLNQELWQELFSLTQDRQIVWKKVLGHTGDALNERADTIATSFADKKPVKLYNGLKQGYNLFH